MDLDSDLIDFSSTTTNKSVEISQRDWSRIFYYKVWEEKKYVSIEGFSKDFNQETLSKLFIPSEINEYPVKEIDTYAFYQNHYIQYIYLPNTIDCIGNYAFESCINLNSIEGLNNVKELGVGAFKNCESLYRIELPKKLLNIRKYAFSGCVYLNSIILPDSLEKIEAGAFKNCRNLESIFGGCNIKEIGSECFYNCKSLKEIKLSKKLMNIGELSFFSCDKLISVVIPNQLEKIDVGTFENCKNLKSVYVGDNVKEIGDRCFSDCVSLENVNLQKNLVSIGAHAFSSCNKLISIRLPYCLEKISVGAFENCKNLKSVYGGNNVKELDYECFFNCVSLEEITLSKVLIKIGGYAFSGCKNLKTIALPDCLEEIGVDAFKNCNHVKVENFHIERFQKKSCKRILYIKDMLSSDDLDEHEFNDFYEFVAQNNNFLILNEQENNSIFYTDDRINCGPIYGQKEHGESIEELSITSQCVRYKQDCDNDYVDDRKKTRYASCPTVLGGIDFEFAWSESFINYKIKEIFYLYEEFLGYKVSFTSFLANELSDMIEQFDYYFHKKFFKNTLGYFFHKLHEICYAFYGWDGSAFISCINEIYHNYLILEDVSKLSLESADKLSITDKLSLPLSVIEIGENTFKGSKVSYIKGDSVNKIGKSAFQHCKNLHGFQFPNLEEIDSLAFSGCSSLKKIILPNTVKKIGSKAFSKCAKLKELYIPAEIEEIENFAFQDCENLRKITIPKRFIENKSIFKNCNKLKIVEFTSEEIQDLAFDKNKITSIQNQTNLLAVKLDEIFIEDTDDLFQDKDEIPKESNISSINEQNKLKIPESQRQFLVYMSEKEIVSRTEAQSMCKSLNIMLEGVLDSLNDKGFELFDDVIFELDDNEIFVNQNYAKELVAKTYWEGKKTVIEKNIQTVKTEQQKRKIIVVVKKHSKLINDKTALTLQNRNEEENNSIDPMEIIKKEIGGVVIIKFNKKPPEQALEILKATGWRYNNIQQTWYSSELSNKGCFEFAQRMKKHFFP